ncbi:glycosyltransferase family 2 protein [Persicobacter diffluens]|uniref:Glycosyltransferase 2-like domain-containing protein n=1 Tax=Persicobacter diffluens TaxID=981 RepID=A0AAN4VWZ7_9BACT|nr:hypothetical protein PEDI_13210 [Persicobacter diffluens]
MNTYLERYAYPERFLSNEAQAHTTQIVVIPCYNEPDLLTSLQSLANCKPTKGHTEVITVINHGENASEEVIQRNQQTLEEAQAWASAQSLPHLSFEFIKVSNLPKKHAGVGLARKIGMDEAAYRLEILGKSKAPIICFDADSQCSENYLLEIEQYFQDYPKTNAASIHFEHPLEGDFPKQWYEAIEIYELHLRYYVNGLRYAQHPFAYETIGSSMVVRADIYQKQGGMNRRKAGEDFYFLHKIIPLGNFADITSCQVIPSPRPSDRVPFGTGKAVGEFLASGETQRMDSYHPEIFEELKVFIEKAYGFFKQPFGAVKEEMPAATQAFLVESKFEEELQKILKNSPNKKIFKQRFFQWFDGFRTLKYVHFLRDYQYPPIDLRSGVDKLFNLLEISQCQPAQQLESMRAYDRHLHYSPKLSNWD